MSNNGVGGSSSVVLVQQQETHYHEAETKVILQVGSSYFQETHHHKIGTEDEPSIRVPRMSHNGAGGYSFVGLV